MIRPYFLAEQTEQSNDRISFHDIDLADAIRRMGLDILSYGVVDKKTNALKQHFKDLHHDRIKTVLEKLLTKKQSSDTIQIVWTDANKYAVECNISFVTENLDNIINEDWDFWIIPSSNDWLIEYYHEGEISYYEIR